MNRVLCSSALMLMLTACGAEQKSATPSADATPVASAAPAVTTSEVPAVPATTDTVVAPAADHDVTGSYVPMDPLPADFALDHLLLATIDENAAPAPLNGFLRPKSPKADDFKLIDPVISGRRLTFVTSSNGGVQYAFEGEFAVLGKFAENPPSYETTVLTGTLKCSRNGTLVASTPVRFRYEAGG